MSAYYQAEQKKVATLCFENVARIKYLKTAAIHLKNHVRIENRPHYGNFCYRYNIYLYLPIFTAKIKILYTAVHR
jgi:hypothetical protein